MLKQKHMMLFILLAVFLLLVSCKKHASDTASAESMTFGGWERIYRLHIPSSYDKAVPRPLVIALHGGGGTGENMVTLSQGGLDALSDENGFVVVYPDGIEKQWNDGRSGEETGYRAHEENIDDVGFISALIDELVNKLNIDQKRVYATGMSNGAMMSYRLGCALSGKLAAIAPVAGNIPQNLYPSCLPSMPISVLAINNVNDPLMPFDGGHITGPFGFTQLGQVLSTPDSVAFWVDHDTCSLSPAITYEPDTDPNDGTRVRKELYGNCKEGTEVVLYAIEGGGHTWPGGYQYIDESIVGKTSRDIDANKVIWDFFEKHAAP